MRSRDLRIGCIGAGMIMAECHLAAYKDAGFPVVAIASRTRDRAAAGRRALGHPQGPRHAGSADRGPASRDRRPRLPARPAARSRQARAEAAAHQGDPRPETAVADAGRGDRAARGGEGRRQAPLGQPEHALRPVDARAEADPRQGRARRAGLRRDRHARHPALADLPRGLRPADARQHERPPSRRAALPVRRPDRDLHHHPHRPAHHLRAQRRHHRLDAPLPVRPAGAVAGGRVVRARARRATTPMSISPGGSRAPTASPRAPSAGRPARCRRSPMPRRRRPAANG